MGAPVGARKCRDPVAYGASPRHLRASPCPAGRSPKPSMRLTPFEIRT